MEITEEQRARAERNRLAALEKRKASTQGLMGLFKCRKISPERQEQFLPKFRARLEICSPDSFMITPLPLPGFPYTGEFDCLQKLSSWLSFAIAIACCFLNEGSILVVCPAILRFSWAEELERWLPILSPKDIHLGMHREFSSIFLFALMIKAILDFAGKVKRKVLLSGTPSLSRPGLLGTSKYEFAKTYCEAKIVQGAQGKVFQDFSKGVRLEELNVLLTQTVMIRRLKEHLLVQLPPKRQQIVSLVLGRSDINMAVSAMKEGDTSSMENRQETEPMANNCSSEDDDDVSGIPESVSESDDECGCPKSSRELSNQELGIAKFSGFQKWLAIHPIVSQPESEGYSDVDLISHKMIVFAHHIKVLDKVQNFLCEKDIKFVRIDGKTLARDRQLAVQEFRSSPEVKIAIIGITAGGVGVDFSSAQNVVFLELPKSVSVMLQAEDRAHRRGQTKAVNIYIFCAKDTSDDLHWQYLNKSLHRVSSVMNGKYDAVQEIAIGGVSDLRSKERRAKFVEPEEYDIQDRTVEAADENHDIKSDNTVCEDMLQTKEDDGDSDAELVRSSGSSESLKCSSSEIWSIRRYSEKEKLFLAPDGDRNISVQVNEANSIPADSLRFEVSQFTGESICTLIFLERTQRQGHCLRIFRIEELESLNDSAVNERKDRNPNLLKENPAYKNVLWTFIKEWNNLRPIEQKKLFGKPLRCPLSLELCFLKESISHCSGGLLKGGSKRRMTPLSEISHPLPENAVWKKISLCISYRKKEIEYVQGWSITGEPLCKLCQKPCKGKFARSPEIFEHLFCQFSCAEGYRVRTSQRFLREELFKIEHGVCRGCGLDCHKLVRFIRPLPVARRKEYIVKVAPKLASDKRLLDKLVNEPREGNAWHADHMVAVYRGGGECTVDNMRTLCVACHKEVTAAQAAERRVTRINAKKRLKGILLGLSNGSKIETINSSLMVDDEDELLVKVPGSAYTGSELKCLCTETTTTNYQNNSFGES
ncbi:hypothetical protein IFM89_020063 [Coptis chinensis]|uniref:Helicase C-terminal domain-containing protein n=1 Tax=Coptis chinensis TaxID=261450 RepID=A0A835H4E4_9MAGN|nr:hypothetical protein IFM89_020063 [Coptis chinensis]